jgi:hypothetical protein
MHSSLLPRLILSSVVSGALLAACSTAASQLPAPGGGALSTGSSSSAALPGPRRIPSLRLMAARFIHKNPAHPKPFVNVAAVNSAKGNQTFVSSLGTNTVSIWSAGRQLNGILYDGLDAPFGLATDASETLYVANAVDSNVLIYPKPYTAYTRVLTDFGGQPTGVAVSSKGIVAVSNTFDPSTGGNGSVTIYAKGASSPCVRLTNPGWREMGFDAFDKDGNIYVNGINIEQTKVVIGEISGGCKATSIHNVGFGDALQSLGGVQVYNGKLLVLDPAGATLYTYDFRSQRALGPPSVRTTLPHLVEPVSFAMLADNPALWVTDEYWGVVYQYAYPTGDKLKVLNNGISGPFGVAVNPAQNP